MTVTWDKREITFIVRRNAKGRVERGSRWINRRPAGWGPGGRIRHRVDRSKESVNDHFVGEGAVLGEATKVNANLIIHVIGKRSLNAKHRSDSFAICSPPANYAFELGEHMFSIRVSGTKVNDNTRYQNPLDLSEKDPELLEIGAPEYAGNIFLKYQIGGLSLGWQSQFISEMLLGNGPEVETYETLFGPSILMDDMWIHDFNGSYAIQDNVNLSFGVRNVTEEEPFTTTPSQRNSRLHVLDGTQPHPDARR